METKTKKNPGNTNSGPSKEEAKSKDIKSTDKTTVDNTDLQGKLDKQQRQIDKLTNQLGKSAEEPTVDKRGFPLRPSFEANELSEMVPLDKYFNKVRSYNKGTVKSPSEVVEKVDYIHFHLQNKKHTFWRGLALTNDQIKELPEDYVNIICGKQSEKV